MANPQTPHPVFDFRPVVNSDGSPVILPRACRVCSGDVCMNGFTDGTLCFLCAQRHYEGSWLLHATREGEVRSPLPQFCVTQFTHSAPRHLNQSGEPLDPSEVLPGTALDRLLRGQILPPHDFPFQTAVQAQAYINTPPGEHKCVSFRMPHDDANLVNRCQPKLAQGLCHAAKSKNQNARNPFVGLAATEYDKAARKAEADFAKKINAPGAEKTLQANALTLIQKVVNVHFHGVPPEIADTPAGKKHLDKDIACSERVEALEDVLLDHKRIAIDLLEGTNLDDMAWGPWKYWQLKVGNFVVNLEKKPANKLAGFQSQRASTWTGRPHVPKAPMPVVPVPMAPAPLAPTPRAPTAMASNDDAQIVGSARVSAPGAAPKRKGDDLPDKDDEQGMSESAPKRNATRKSRSNPREIFPSLPPAVLGVPVSRGQDNDSRGADSGSISNDMVGSHERREKVQYGQTQARRPAMQPPHHVDMNSNAASAIAPTMTPGMTRYEERDTRRAPAGAPTRAVRSYQAPAASMSSSSSGSGSGMVPPIQRTPHQDFGNFNVDEPAFAAEGNAQGHAATPVDMPPLSTGEDSTPGMLSPGRPRPDAEYSGATDPQHASYWPNATKAPSDKLLATSLDGNQTQSAAYQNAIHFSQPQNWMGGMGMPGNNAMDLFGTFQGGHLMQPTAWQEKGKFALPAQGPQGAGVPAHDMADQYAGFQGSNLMQPATSCETNNFLAQQDLTGDADESGDPSINGAAPFLDNSQSFDDEAMNDQAFNGQAFPGQVHNGKKVFMSGAEWQREIDAALLAQAAAQQGYGGVENVWSGPAHLQSSDVMSHNPALYNTQQDDNGGFFFPDPDVEEFENTAHNAAVTGQNLAGTERSLAGTEKKSYPQF